MYRRVPRNLRRSLNNSFPRRGQGSLTLDHYTEAVAPASQFSLRHELTFSIEMKLPQICLNHLKIFCVFSVLVAGLHGPVRALSRETIRCRCDTKECQLQRSATCTTKGSCYVQESQPSLFKDRTRGCIAGEASQSLLCTTHSLPSFLKETRRWPRLVCCSSDLCNAPALLNKLYNDTQPPQHLSGLAIPTFNDTQSLMDTSKLSNGTPDDTFIEKQNAGFLSREGISSTKTGSRPKERLPKDASLKCPPESVGCEEQHTQRMDDGDGRGAERYLAPDGLRSVNERMQAAHEDGAPLLHTVLMVLTVLCTVMLCTIVLLVYASARYSAVPSKYCTDTGLHYVMV
ncbi:Activin types I and II receptor domain [Trinorchestia longiramus]|nr:Activin types I and II receptor domain [Trinorchestia longiramus]